MLKFNKDKLIKYVFLFLSIANLITFSCLLMFFIVFLDFLLLTFSIIAFILFIVFYRLAWLKNQGYKLKFYFSNKIYKEKILPSIEKFKGAPEFFIQDLKYRTKRTYRYAGYLFSRDINDLIYKDKNSKDIILHLYEILYNSIETRGGFIKFFTDAEKLKIESNWQMHNYMIIDLISYELEYLLNVVYELTDFTIYDNKISEEFTLRNNQTIKDLNEIYSPLLFNFKEEIYNVIQKLKSL